MAKISDLPEVVDPDGTETAVVLKAGAAHRVPMQPLVEAAASGVLDQAEVLRDEAAQQAQLANRYANSNSNVDMPGAAPGERGAQYWMSVAAAWAASAINAVRGVADGARVYTGSGSVLPLFTSKGPGGRQWALGWDRAVGAFVAYVRIKGSEFYNSVADAPVIQKGMQGIRTFTGAGNIPLFTLNRRELFSFDRARQKPLWHGGYWPSRRTGAGLTQWRAAVAQVRAGTGKAKVMMQGDSYCEIATIPAAVASILRPKYGDIGGGWIAVQGAGPLDAATFATSAGWTIFDDAQGATILALPTVGVSFDGKVIYTTATDQTATWTFTGTEFRLNYGNKVAGAFRVRVDGGAWTTITSDATGTNGVYTRTGLSAGAHTVELDTSVNTGTAAIYGLYFTNTVGVGVEILKCGNGSLHAGHLATYVGTFVAPMIANIAPDVIVMSLVTNDYVTNNSSPALMVSTYRTYVSVVRALLPNVGFVFMIAPDTSLTPVSGTIADYANAVEAFCRQDGHEFYSMYDEFGTWAVENARGMFSGDPRHMNSTAAIRPASRIDAILSL